MTRSPSVKACWFASWAKVRYQAEHSAVWSDPMDQLAQSCFRYDDTEPLRDRAQSWLRSMKSEGFSVARHRFHRFRNPWTEDRKPRLP